MEVKETVINTLHNVLLRKKPLVCMADAADLLEKFQKEAVLLIAAIVKNTLEVELAVEIVVGKMQFKTREVTYGEISDLMGYSRSAYDHHGYPTAYDLDKEAGMFSPLLEGVETKEAIVLLNDPTEFRKLLDQRLVESLRERNQEKLCCPKCKSSQFIQVGWRSSTDHHQIDYMTSYVKFRCNSCGYECEEEERKN